MSGFWMAIISWGSLFQTMVLLDRNENLYASVLHGSKAGARFSVSSPKGTRCLTTCGGSVDTMTVNVMNGLH